MNWIREQYGFIIFIIFWLGIFYILIKGKITNIDKTDPECQQLLLDIKKYKIKSNK